MMADMKADLVVLGDAQFNPDDVQREYGLVADEICHVGDQIGNTILKRKYNSWAVSGGKIKGYGLSECLNLLMKKIAPQWEGLLALSARSGVETQLSIAVYVYDEVPALDCNREVVGRMAELHADIDIDLIILGGED